MNTVARQGSRLTTIHGGRLPPRGPLSLPEVVVVLRGTVVSFDRIKGYGFVAPETGGEDVFVHVNDVLDDKSLVNTGSVVQFRLDTGDRGPKASQVTVLAPVLDGPGGPDLHNGHSSAGDGPAAVLTAAQFRHDLTELLLHSAAPLTGGQILAVRDLLADYAAGHGWLDG